MTKDQLMASIVNIVPEASYLHNQENVSIDKLLNMAAEKCFIQKIETPEAVDIRWALKQLKTYGYIALIETNRN